MDEGLTFDDFEKCNRLMHGEFFNICQDCGGECEYTQLALFLPGEAEYIADELDMDIDTFKKQYVNILKFENNEINLLKLGICPFLRDDKRCELGLKDVKPIVCKLYPLWIGMKEGKMGLLIDEDFCPKSFSIPTKFKRQALEVFKVLEGKIPDYWLKFETEFDDYIFDYSKFKKIRNKQIVELDELLKCRM